MSTENTLDSLHVGCENCRKQQGELPVIKGFVWHQNEGGGEELRTCVCRRRVIEARNKRTREIEAKREAAV